MRGSRFLQTLIFVPDISSFILDAASQSLFAFMTAEDIVRPTRTTQGGCNSAANFQAKVEPCFATLQNKLLVWLDYFFLHENTEQEHLDVLEKRLHICAERTLIIFILLSRLIVTSIEWCGHLIDSSGVCLNLARYSALTNACEPRTGAKLSQYVHCIN